MADSVQDALADVALRLQSLKAAVAGKELGGDGDVHQLAAIKALTQDLVALLQPSLAPISIVQAQGSAREAPNGAAPAAGAPFQPAGLPRTPFEQRRGTALTPGGGLPATTPLAAEVLAGLNGLAVATDAPAAADRAEGDAAETLSGLFSGHPLASGPTDAPRQQGSAAAPLVPALASLLQDAQLLPAHTAAMAAATAAALPIPRRQSAGTQLLLPLPVVAPREQRPCNCKRSMCLKMYCECFAAGGFCAPSCSCLNCSNTPGELEAVAAARDVVLAKNPRAFEAKVTATAGHKRGCRCKRSKCLKKYCECFHAGARCNPDVCQCEDCRNTEGDAMLMPLLATGKQHVEHMPWAADTSVDVLAMFGGPAGASDASLSSQEGVTQAGARRGKAGAQALPPLPSLSGPFAFALPPLPAASGHHAATHGASQPGFGADAAAALLAPGMFAAPPLPAFDRGFRMRTPAAAFDAAERQQQQLEESMADAASQPALAAAAAGSLRRAATPGAAKVASALTSHLSDVAGPADPEMHDTATSPAPLMAMAKLTARRTLGPANAAPTLTGGGAACALGRPPLPTSRVRSRAGSPASQGSADENDSCNTAGSQRGSKRPRRAASGGVLGAVAAEAAEWGLDVVSPPLKRANSLPAAMDAGKRGGKVSDRVALLKRALAGETAAAAAHYKLPGPHPCGMEEAPSAEDADAISALFELSSSLC